MLQRRRLVPSLRHSDRRSGRPLQRRLPATDRRRRECLTRSHLSTTTAMGCVAVWLSSASYRVSARHHFFFSIRRPNAFAFHIACQINSFSDRRSLPDWQANFVHSDRTTYSAAKLIQLVVSCLSAIAPKVIFWVVTRTTFPPHLIDKTRCARNSNRLLTAPKFYGQYVEPLANGFCQG